MRQRLLFALACAALLAAACAPKPVPMGGDDITRGSKQLLLVVAEDWDSTRSRLERFERREVDGEWSRIGQPATVNLGRSGLGWGRGLHGVALGPGPVKREGDGRAPAGVFALGAGFAYDPAQTTGVKLSMERADTDLVCVDDVKSRYYNRMVRKSQMSAMEWDSAEDMLRKDGQYRLGVFVQHNTEPVVAGSGSCIFLHIWLGEGVASSGCTNMDAPDMLTLLRWLDPDKKPILVQVIRRDYTRYHSAWKLP